MRERGAVRRARDVCVFRRLDRRGLRRARLRRRRQAVGIRGELDPRHVADGGPVGRPDACTLRRVHSAHAAADADADARADAAADLQSQADARADDGGADLRDGAAVELVGAPALTSFVRGF